MARLQHGSSVTGSVRARRLALEPYMTDAAFWANVDIGDDHECWLWKGKLSNSGHPHWRGNSVGHAVAHDAKHGAIAPGLEHCHNCHNAACCNPDHIRGDTHAANMAEMGARRRGKPARVLTEAIVRAAKLMRAAGKLIKDIAEEFKVRADTLGKALQGKTWAWVSA